MVTHMCLEAAKTGTAANSRLLELVATPVLGRLAAAPSCRAAFHCTTALKGYRAFTSTARITARRVFSSLPRLGFGSP